MESVEAYLLRNGLEHKRSQGAKGTEFAIPCPSCGKGGKASINATTWLWHCFSASCGAGGGEYELKRLHGNLYEIKSKAGEKSFEAEQRDRLAHALAQRVRESDVTRWHRALMDLPEAQSARDYCAERGLSTMTLKQGGVGWSAVWPGGGGQAVLTARQRLRSTLASRYGLEQPESPSEGVEAGWLTLPYLTRFNANTGDSTQLPDLSSAALVKCRDLRPDASPKYRRIAGGESLLYLPCGLDPDKPVLLVGGEMDALSCIEAGWTNVAAPSLGETNWSDLWSRQLVNAQDIVIVYDNDEAGQQGAKAVAQRLGMARCRIGRWPDPFKDANEALVAGKLDADTIQLVVDAARRPTVEGVYSLAHLRDDFMASLGDGVNRGLPTGWSDLDELFGGWRPGEVTLVTGDTGCGKTTLTSQMALFYARHHGPVLYAPFEMGPHKQLRKWITQLARKPLNTIDKGAIEDTFDGLEELPIWMLYRKHITPEGLRNTLLYAVRAVGVRFIVLDHMHWLLDPSANAYEQLNVYSRLLEDVAKETGAHVVYVAHPKGVFDKTAGKDRDNKVIQLSDIKGSSELKQNTHNALSVWKPRRADRSDVVAQDGYGQTVVYVLKVRDDLGKEGSVALRFHLESALAFDLAPHELFTHTQRKGSGGPCWTPNRKL